MYHDLQKCYELYQSVVKLQQELQEIPKQIEGCRNLHKHFFGESMTFLGKLLADMYLIKHDMGATVKRFDKIVQTKSYEPYLQEYKIDELGKALQKVHQDLIAKTSQIQETIKDLTGASMIEQLQNKQQTLQDSLKQQKRDLVETFWASSPNLQEMFDNFSFLIPQTFIAHLFETHLGRSQNESAQIAQYILQESINVHDAGCAEVKLNQSDANVIQALDKDCFYAHIDDIHHDPVTDNVDPTVDQDSMQVNVFFECEVTLKGHLEYALASAVPITPKHELTDSTRFLTFEAPASVQCDAVFDKDGKLIEMQTYYQLQHIFFLPSTLNIQDKNASLQDYFEASIALTRLLDSNSLSDLVKKAIDEDSDRIREYVKDILEQQNFGLVVELSS